MANPNPKNQFIKGKSGNPGGRPPKGYSITETIKSMMDEKPEIKRALSSKIFEMALKGDITAIKMLWNYMDGMPIQTQQIGGVDGESIKFNIIAGASYFSTLGESTASPNSNNNNRPAEIQGSSVAQESEKNNDSDKPDSSVEST